MRFFKFCMISIIICCAYKQTQSSQIAADTKQQVSDAERLRLWVFRKNSGWCSADCYNINCTGECMQEMSLDTNQVITKMTKDMHIGDQQEQDAAMAHFIATLKEEANKSKNNSNKKQQ